MKIREDLEIITKKYESFYIRHNETAALYFEKPKEPKGQVYALCLMVAPPFPGKMDEKSSNFTLVGATEMEGKWSWVALGTWEKEYFGREIQKYGEGIYQIGTWCWIDVYVYREED